MARTNPNRPDRKTLQRWNTRSTIIEAAIPVFEAKGYDGSNILDITRAANVAAGSLNNCFGNKERLGAYVTLALLRHALAPVQARLSFDDDPILYALTCVDTYITFMMEKGCRQFFMDSLKYDFIFNYLTSVPRSLATRLIERYRSDVNDDLTALYAEYLPYMLGRALILKKEQGYFTDIPADEIAFLVCRVALHSLVDEANIRLRVPESRRISAEICETLPGRPSKEIIDSAVRELSTLMPSD